ncbi:DNA-binding FadR family transcriptional regulator [Labrys wisconsinensis]|uniref:DNA-binding FadR family transcriptional regulator n=2 Tax=Labrys wisconsinensis TaxID=425677 RepID=A0ABU0JLK2_9HYPH|nr:FadR/GntR family transcriptional regulator [Labrys wisconsinensis]MDQ0475177.1 DNA-binding FadR family transcriptional regulator [Labrys wisconsinensis]
MDESATPAGGLVGRVMDEVNAFIRDNELGPGAVIPSESSFAERTGVSRAVAREAFRAMSALKLIDVGNGRRAKVAPADESVVSFMIDHAVRTRQVTVQQILDVRRTIELRTVALAALRRTDREAREIDGIAAEMRTSFAQPERVMELDIAFHEAIARASRNPLFVLLVGAFRVVTRQTWSIGWASRPSDAGRHQSVDGHALIAAAIVARDVRGAETAMADHFDLTVKVLLNAGVN